MTSDTAFPKIPAPLVAIRGVSKKFCKDLKFNMAYGIVDMVRQAMGLPVGLGPLRAHEFFALKDISVDILPGQIVAVVGANGSGKTTLMRLISGIYTLDTGEIIRPATGRITSVFALNAGLNPLFTGMENIHLKGAMFGMTKEEIRQKLDFIIEFSELEEFIHSPVGNYSSGMRARLAYAVAIATEPDLFIIDEALAVGDTVFKAKCYEHLQTYVREKPRAVLYVTNRISKVMAIANRLLVMRKGQLVRDTEDIQSGLTFYIENCLEGMDANRKVLRMKMIRHYEM